MGRRPHSTVAEKIAGEYQFAEVATGRYMLIWGCQPYSPSPILLDMISVTIDTCGKCGHLYFPGEDLFKSDAFGVVCGDCEDALSEGKILSNS